MSRLKKALQAKYSGQVSQAQIAAAAAAGLPPPVPVQIEILTPKNCQTIDLEFRKQKIGMRRACTRTHARLHTRCILPVFVLCSDGLE